MILHVDDIACDTIIAALRLWQARHRTLSTQERHAIDDMATGLGKHGIMQDHDIDGLIARMIQQRN